MVDPSAIKDHIPMVDLIPLVDLIPMSYPIPMVDPIAMVHLIPMTDTMPTVGSVPMVDALPIVDQNPNVCAFTLIVNSVRRRCIVFYSCYRRRRHYSTIDFLSRAQASIEGTGIHLGHNITYRAQARVRNTG